MQPNVFQAQIVGHNENQVRPRLSAAPAVGPATRRSIRIAARIAVGRKAEARAVNGMLTNSGRTEAIGRV